jgi:hypothetical protein
LRQSQVNFKTFLAGSVIFALTCYMFVFRSWMSKIIYVIAPRSLTIDSLSPSPAR